MYFRASDLPELSNLSHSARKEFISEAIAKYDGTKALRFSVACGFLLALSVIAGIAKSYTSAPTWYVGVFSLICGLLFYVYILWEINSSTAKAVKKLLQERQHA